MWNWRVLHGGANKSPPSTTPYHTIAQYLHFSFVKFWIWNSICHFYSALERKKCQAMKRTAWSVKIFLQINCETWMNVFKLMQWMVRKLYGKIRWNIKVYFFFGAKLISYLQNPNHCTSEIEQVAYAAKEQTAKALEFVWVFFIEEVYPLQRYLTRNTLTFSHGDVANQLYVNDPVRFPLKQVESSELRLFFISYEIIIII